MTITLTDEQAEFVRRRVECGKNASEQEVLDQALDALHADELEEEVGQDVVKAAIEEGTGQLRRGEGVTLKGKEDVRRCFVELKEEGRQALRANSKSPS